VAQALTENDIHVWYCFCDDPQVVEHQDTYRALLTDDERQRRERFAFEKDRNLFLVARVLLRTTLSRYADVPPAQWRFAQTARGKLFLPEDADTPPLSFNVSHSGKAAVCAVTLSHPIGVDIESTDRRTEQKVARYFLSPAEMAEFQRAEGAAKKDLFYRYWTLKEAYAKALGMGLSVRFTEFTFRLGQDRSPTISFDRAGEDGAERHWHFFQTPIEPHYVLAVAVNRPGDRPPSLQVRHAPPHLD
jgi:4'-phosphopantetheinyl transferase